MAELTQEEYIEVGGEKCPICTEANIRIGHMQTSGGALASRSLKCRACGAEWLENYAMYGYSDLAYRDKR